MFTEASRSVNFVLEQIQSDLRRYLSNSDVPPSKRIENALELLNGSTWQTMRDGIHHSLTCCEERIYRALGTKES